MNKHVIKAKVPINEELIKRATKADWRVVREATNLSRVQIHYYRSGKRLVHQKVIEEALAKAISLREKAEKKHEMKIAKLLNSDIKPEGLDYLDISKKLSEKYK
jgi:protein-disulfide isomerase-like protein with CxxC motif